MASERAGTEPSTARPGPSTAGPGAPPPEAPRPARGVVMRDVARLAGVSHQTVSRVLNGHPSVRPETRTRVVAAMRALNYRRNLAARTLVTRRSRTLGLVAFETTLFGPAATLYGVEQAARDAGYFVSVASVRSLDRDSVLAAIDRLCEQSVEGIVAIAPKRSVISALAQAPAGLPVVGVGGAGAAVPTVRIDNVAGADLATRHLLALGHRSVHHVAGPPDWPEARARLDGWRAALRAAGAPVPPPHRGDWSARSGYQHGQRLAADPSVTAVFCANDQIALGVLRALHEADRRVPGEVSVVGFDDLPESAYFIPPLTTVRQDFAELGRRSLELLVDQLAGADRVSRRILLTPEFVPRASSAPPPRR